LECDSSESDDVQTPPEHDYVLSLRSYLTEEQKEKVVMLLRNIQPRTLAFVAIMKKSSVEPPHSSLVDFLSSSSVLSRIMRLFLFSTLEGNYVIFMFSWPYISN
jgi:hypothetical protein